MSGVVFVHPNPSLGTLTLRLAPTAVNWGYELNTATTQTYAGEVVQVLGIKFTQFTIEGQFGKEGPHGRVEVGGRLQDRPLSEFDNWKSVGGYGVGLAQMTAYFRQYFAVASQGIDDKTADSNFDERPMSIIYDGAIDIEVDVGGRGDQVWQVYPVSFPSYQRSNEDFGPKWKVVCEVAEAPGSVQTAQFLESLKRLRAAVGYRAYNPYSDPLGALLVPGQTLDENALAVARDKIKAAQGTVIDYYKNFIPAYDSDPASVRELIFGGASAPTDLGKSLNTQVEEDPTAPTMPGHHLNLPPTAP